MDTQHEERQEYLHRAHLLVRIRQSRLIVELITLYSIKVVGEQSRFSMFDCLKVSPTSCSIHGIEIQNGELLGGEDEEVAAALGLFGVCTVLSF
jgi:hypothetical protein